MQQQPTSSITLRRAMQSREGDADYQISRGRRAWAVERRDVTYTGDLQERPQTAIVFGTCRSDALRRAQYGARLGESHHGTDWRLAEITSGWDEPFVWPLPREVVALSTPAEWNRSRGLVYEDER